MSREAFKKWAMQAGFPQMDWPNMFQAWQARQTEIDALKAENERLRKDAARYQFLRDKERPIFAMHHLQHAPSECDARIDAAMKEPKRSPQEIMEVLKDDETLGEYIVKITTAAPPEVEPYAYAYERHDLPDEMRELYPFYNSIHRKQIKPIPSDWKEIPLYTHPASDELQKAAEEVSVAILALEGQGIEYRLAVDLANANKNLRAVLDKVKS